MSSNKKDYVFEGELAFENKVKISECTYEKGSDEYKQWLHGYASAAKLAEEVDLEKDDSEPCECCGKCEDECTCEDGECTCEKEKVEESTLRESGAPEDDIAAVIAEDLDAQFGNLIIEIRDAGLDIDCGGSEDPEVVEAAILEVMDDYPWASADITPNGQHIKVFIEK